MPTRSTPFEAVSVANVPYVPLDPQIKRRLRREAKKAREGTTARDRAIVDAHLAGGSLREIAREVEMSHIGVRAIVHRDTDPERRTS